MNSVEIDDGRAVNAHKLVLVQVTLEVQERPAQDMSVSADMQTRVITDRFHPIDVRDVEKQHLVAAFHYDSLCPMSLRRSVVRDFFLGTTQGKAEAPIVRGL